jgi:hypothetical protein
MLCAAVSMRASLAGPDRISTAAPVLGPAPATAPAPMSYDAQNDAIKTYCVGCHNDVDMKGELSLDSFDAAHARPPPRRRCASCGPA